MYTRHGHLEEEGDGDHGKQRFHPSVPNNHGTFHPISLREFRAALHSLELDLALIKIWCWTATYTTTTKCPKRALLCHKALDNDVASSSQIYVTCKVDGVYQKFLSDTQMRCSYSCFDTVLENTKCRERIDPK